MSGFEWSQLQNPRTLQETTSRLDAELSRAQQRHPGLSLPPGESSVSHVVDGFLDQDKFKEAREALEAHIGASARNEGLLYSLPASSRPSLATCCSIICAQSIAISKFCGSRCCTYFVKGSFNAQRCSWSENVRHALIKRMLGHLQRTVVQAYLA